MVDLLDLGFLDAWGLQVLDVSSIEGVVHQGLQPKEDVSPNILMPGNMEDAKVLKRQHQSLYFVQLLAIIEFQASYLSVTWLVTSRELVKTFCRSTPSCLMSFRLARRASCLAWLLITLNEKYIVFGAHPF